MQKASVFFFILVFYFFSSQAQDTTQKVNLNRFNDLVQQEKPYVILIAIDGFRWDLADKFNAKNLITLRESGVQAAYLQSSFPSLTFPNHYTIATGLYPAHHGIVDNNFYDKKRGLIFRKSDKKMALDSSWYAGKPLWTLAEQQNMLSAVFYWPGSEVAIDGIKPTYYYDYNEIIPTDRRLAAIKNWLQLPAEKRPHFIALYFHQVDKAGHDFTLDSEEAKAAVLLVDEAVGKLVQIAKDTNLPVNFVVVSDHGMTTVDVKNYLPLPSAVKLTEFIVPPGNALLQLYAKNKTFIQPAYQELKKDTTNYQVYLSKNLPKAWKYNLKEDFHNRIGDIILIPKLPKVFSTNGLKPNAGQHGFDPAIADMHAIFYASGPQLNSGQKINAFENVHIYPLIAKILGLTVPQKIDGDLKVLQSILKNTDVK
jgi:predicted AlkP superfamily pyrophosphatase or phosphodiesterase